MKTLSHEEFLADFQAACEQAVVEPTRIRFDGQDSLVILSDEEYRRLKRRDRIAMKIEDLPEGVVEELARTEMDPIHNHLNALLAEDEDKS